MKNHSVFEFREICDIIGAILKGDLVWNTKKRNFIIKP